MMKARDASVIDLGISSHDKLPHCCFALIALLLLLLALPLLLIGGFILFSYFKTPTQYPLFSFPIAFPSYI